MRKWFLNLSTVAKLSLAFGAGVLVALVMGVVGYQSIMQLHHDAITVNELNKGTLVSLVRVRFQSEAAKEILDSVSGDKLAGPKADEFLRTARQIHDEAQKVFASEQTIFELSKQELPFLVRMSGQARTQEANKEADDAIKEIGNSLTDFKEQVTQMPGLEGDESDAATTGIVDVKTARATLVAVIAEAQTLEGAIGSLAAKAVGDMDLQKDFGRLIMGGGALVGALIAILVGVITTRVIVEPLREMTAAAHRISEGDLTAEITHESSDEVGGLADSFRAMQGALR
ncbi:MAG: HAMP domain-containing protein, partial [Planctomycetota bacterium]